MRDEPQANAYKADPAILPQWFGPEGYHCTTKEIDLREGGLWRFDMIGPDGTVWANRHRFTLHDAPRRIEFLMDADTDAAPPFEVVVTLTPESGGTRLTQVMTFPTAEARDGAGGRDDARRVADVHQHPHAGLLQCHGLVLGELRRLGQRRRSIAACAALQSRG